VRYASVLALFILVSPEYYPDTARNDAAEILPQLVRAHQQEESEDVKDYMQRVIKFIRPDTPGDGKAVGS